MFASKDTITINKINQVGDISTEQEILANHIYDEGLKSDVCVCVYSGDGVQNSITKIKQPIQKWAKD